MADHYKTVNRFSSPMTPSYNDRYTPTGAESNRATPSSTLYVTARDAAAREELERSRAAEEVARVPFPDDDQGLYLNEDFAARTEWLATTTPMPTLTNPYLRVMQMLLDTQKAAEKRYEQMLELQIEASKRHEDTERRHQEALKQQHHQADASQAEQNALLARLTDSVNAAAGSRSQCSSRSSRTRAPKGAASESPATPNVRGITPRSFYKAKKSSPRSVADSLFEPGGEEPVNMDGNLNHLRRRAAPRASRMCPRRR